MVKGDEKSPKIINNKGAKNKDSITADLITIGFSPYLEILFDLKYSDTRDFRVCEKSELSDFENDKFLIKINFN